MKFGYLPAKTMYSMTIIAAKAAVASTKKKTDMAGPSSIVIKPDEILERHYCT